MASISANIWGGSLLGLSQTWASVFGAGPTKCILWSPMRQILSRQIPPMLTQTTCLLSESWTSILAWGLVISIIGSSVVSEIWVVWITAVIIRDPCSAWCWWPEALMARGGFGLRQCAWLRGLKSESCPA